MRRAGRFISLLMVLTAMVACSSREKAVRPGGEISASQQQTALRKKVAALLEKRSYRRAVELMSGRNHQGSPGVGMEREYLLAINGMIATGEDSFSHGVYGVAGQTFRLVLDSYPEQAMLRGRVKRDPLQLRQQLETCANRLMDQGLMEYRSGKLENAILKWKEILLFDSCHKEAIKAVETATVQLRALQNMEKPRR